MFQIQQEHGKGKYIDNDQKYLCKQMLKWHILGFRDSSYTTRQKQYKYRFSYRQVLLLFLMTCVENTSHHS